MSNKGNCERVLIPAVPGKSFSTSQRSRQERVPTRGALPDGSIIIVWIPAFPLKRGTGRGNDMVNALLLLLLHLLRWEDNRKDFLDAVDRMEFEMRFHFLRQVD